MRNKKNKKAIDNGKKEKIVRIGIVIITILFIFIIYKIFDMVVSSNEKIDLTGETYYQYFYGMREEYTGEIEVVRHDDTSQLVLEDKRVVHLDSTPIFYKDILGKVLFPTKMEVVFTDTGVVNRLDSFTNIIQDSYVMYAKKFNKDNTKSLNNAFIYDGNDLYFFLEEMTVTVGEKKYEISPLSYVIVNYRQNVEIYNYDKDEYTIISEDELPKDDIIATNKNKDYKINMSVDSYSTNSSDHLLIKNIEHLNELDY